MTPGTEPIRVLIVDDHKIIRDGLTVVGDVGNRADALLAAASERPDIIVLDLDLGEDSGLDLIPELRRADEEVGIIILTGVRETEKRDRAIELGARGVVLKD